MIKKSIAIPCETNNCTSKESFCIDIGGSKRWLCKDCMQNLIDSLQQELDILTKQTITLDVKNVVQDTKCGHCCVITCGVTNPVHKKCHCEEIGLKCNDCKHKDMCF